MIPIDASKPLVKEKDGVKYFFRYCTEEIEDQFISLTESVVNKKLTHKDYKQYGRELINLFLVGWEGKNLPEFPKDNPAKCFIGGALVKMIKFVESAIPELTGTNQADLKN